MEHRFERPIEFFIDSNSDAFDQHCEDRGEDATEIVANLVSDEELTSDSARTIDDFLAEHWAAFEAHCDNFNGSSRGTEGTTADEVAAELDKLK